MIFGYDELKKYVSEDFERFYKMNFDEKQILPAVLSEYEHGEGFCLTENICVHIFLALKYAENQLDVNIVKQKLRQLVSEHITEEIISELGHERRKYISDLEIVMFCT